MYNYALSVAQVFSTAATTLSITAFICSEVISPSPVILNLNAIDFLFSGKLSQLYRSNTSTLDTFSTHFTAEIRSAK